LRRILYLLLVLTIDAVAYAQQPSEARLHIIGVVHFENQVRNADSLVTILKTINPDLILVETDTISGYFGKGYQLRKPAWWYKLAAKLRLVRKMAPEMKAMYKYKSIEPSIQLLPFDMAIPNRNIYLKTSNKAEYELLMDINGINRKGQIPESLQEEHRTFIRHNNWLYDIRHFGYQHINRPLVTDSIRQLMDFEFRYFSSLFDSIPQLRKHQQQYLQERQFWDRRNQQMAENILSLVESTGSKRVVVLTGLLHKYYLEDLLLASKEKFLLDKHLP